MKSGKEKRKGRFNILELSGKRTYTLEGIRGFQNLQGKSIGANKVIFIDGVISIDNIKETL